MIIATKYPSTYSRMCTSAPNMVFYLTKKNVTAHREYTWDSDKKKVLDIVEIETWNVFEDN